MTIEDKTAGRQGEALSFEFNLAHSPQKVWRALTDPELLGRWLLPLAAPTLDLKPGAGFCFQAPPMPHWDGKVNCQLVEIEPPHKLSYTWVVGDMNTVVTFTLTPTPSGTRLSLLHAGFQPTQKANFGGARYGWKQMGVRLIELLGQQA